MNHQSSHSTRSRAESTSEIHDLRSEVKRLAGRIEEIAEDSAEPILDRAAEVYERMKEQVQEQVESALKSTRKTRDQVQTYVKRNPWKAAAAATLTVGAIAAAWFLTRSEE